MTEPFVETAYAKLNLALHVRARRADGYHQLETLFAFADDGDRLEARAADDLTLSLTGPFAGALDGEGDNLVLRAARALRDATGIRGGAALLLDKRLPVAAGIGGGSADAAAALRLLARLWRLGNIDPLLIDIAATLGADVPACVVSRTVRGDGRGDQLTPAGDRLAGAPLLLVNPRIPLGTATVFRTWDGVDRGPLGDDALAGRNDLEAPAIALVPAIAEVIGSLRGRAGVRLARMSGSGATCFALFDTEDARDRAAAAADPGWWTLSSRLR